MAPLINFGFESLAEDFVDGCVVLVAQSVGIFGENNFSVVDENNLV